MLFGFKFKEHNAILCTAGIIGMLMGIVLMSDINWLGVIFTFFNMYVLYLGLFALDKK